MENPKVFISYSWDSEEHKNWVLALANKLTQDGVYVILDRYDLFAGKNMTHFMERAVEDADKVLNILTKNYKSKADRREGGVGYEYSMVTHDLFINQQTNKFIPIRREGTYQESAPKFLGILVSHDMTNDKVFDQTYKDLLKLIYDQPLVARPAIGKRPSFLDDHTPNFIDDILNLRNCNLNFFGNWKFSIEVSSEYDTAEFFKMLRENFEFDARDNILLPHIVNDTFKTKHHPTIEYEMPLQRYLYGNWFINERLQILKSKLFYQFSEYMSSEPLLLNISQPFTSVFYLLIAIKKLQKSHSLSFEAIIEMEFISNGQALLNQKYSPFEYASAMETYSIPDNQKKLRESIKKIDIDTLYNFYQKLYNIFSSENPRSIKPFVTINKDNFVGLVGNYLK